MYVRFFSTVAVVASFTLGPAITLGSAMAQVGPNLQPTQYPLSPRWVQASQHRVWLRDLYVHLWKNARYPGRDGRAVVRFVLNRSGHIVSAKVEKSSGDAVLDKAALAAVRQADPVPPPPPFLKDQQLVVHAPFNFTKS